MQYCLARYHDCVVPQPDSAGIAREHYLKAIDAHIPDARMFLAYFWRDGDLGVVDHERYIRERDRAVREDSHAAVQQQLRDICFGNGGFEADPELACSMLSRFIRESDEGNSYIDPRYYALYGDILDATGEKEKAISWYSKALDHGDKDAFFDLMVASYMDEDGCLKPSEESSLFFERGQALQCADAFMDIEWAVNPQLWDSYGEELQRDITEELRNSLELAHSMGARLAEYSMGCHLYYGDCGFTQDYDQAFSWFARGAIRRCIPSCRMIVTMFDEGNAPGQYGEDFRYETMIRALRLGDRSMLPRVVEAYENGHYTEYAAEIERYHIPLLAESDDLADDFPDDFPDDDGRYDAWS